MAGGWIGAISVAWVLIGAAPSSASAARLVFVETEPLHTTCASLRGGVEVKIRNETAVTQSPNLTPVEFHDQGGR